MKNITVYLLLAICSISGALAQRINFVQSKYIEYHPDHQLWDDWPDNWSNLDADHTFSMRISEEVRGKVYNVVITKNGETLSDLHVRYDATKTAEVRESWKNPYVNCYYDKNNDYIYAENVSLEQLSKDSEPWKNHDSKIYLWIFSQNYGIALR